MRDLGLEARELRDAAHGVGAFVEHVQRRLAQGQEDVGDRWATRDLDELLSELLEEAADLGAWGVLTLQRLELAGISGRTRARIEALVRGAIGAGADAHQRLDAALAQLETEAPSCR